jgi:predicted dehydrogenase
MAMDVEEATRMIAAADAAGVKLYVAESATYQPQAAFLRNVVRTGRWIGELTSASVTAGFRAPRYGYPERRAWLAQPELGGKGTWTLHGIHTIGQMRYVLGEVAQVYARQHAAASFERDDVEATVSLLLTLEGGVSVQVVQTAETRLYGDLGGYILHGDGGSMRAGPDGCHVFTDTEDGTFVEYPQPALSPHAAELAAFADYVAGAAEGPTTGVSERRSLAVVQAGYESMASGDVVDVAQRFGPL